VEYIYDFARTYFIYQEFLILESTAPAARHTFASGTGELQTK
jgi:hypothetical protein